MKIFARAIATTTVIAASLALVACSPGGDAEPSSDGELTISAGRLGIGHDAIFSIARDQGIYDAHGLTVEDTVVANPPAALAAVQSGQLDVAYTTVLAYLQALAQGIELEAVAPAEGTGVASDDSTSEFDLEQSGLFVNPASSITRPGELTGKTVGVLARNGTSEVGIAAAVQADGGDPTTINWVTLDFASAVEALKSGTIDAAGLVQPFTNQAESEGMQQIAAPTVELFGQGVVTSLWVSTPATVSAKGAAIDAFIASQAEAADYANAHIDEAMAMAKEITGVATPVEEMTPIYWISELDPQELQRQSDLVFDLGYLAQPVNVADAVYAPAS